MRRTSTISARLIEAVPAALGLAVVEWLFIWLHGALHLGTPSYWATMPITWPANLLQHVVDGPIDDAALEALLMVVMYFGLALNTLVLIVLARALWRRLRSRAAPP